MNTRYSLGAYVRETENDLCSSISRASLRAISTGRTSERKARLNVPSTRPAILLSRLRRTLIVWPLWHFYECRDEAFSAVPCYASRASMSGSRGALGRHTRGAGASARRPAATDPSTATPRSILLVEWSASSV